MREPLETSRPPSLKFPALLTLSLTVGAFLATAILARTPAPHAPQEPDSIRVEVIVVPIDVLVLDRRGRPVENLIVEDFLVLENGQPQPITHFERFTIGAPAPAGDRTGSVFESEFLGDGTRTFLIVLGRGRHNYFDAIRSLMRFVGDSLTGNDRVAAMAYNRATSFLRDHRQLLRFFEAFEEAHEHLEAALRARSGELSAAYGSGQIPETLQNQIDDIFRLASIHNVAALDAPEVDLGRDQDRRDLEIMEQERRDEAYEELVEEAGLPDRSFKVSREYNKALARMVSDIPFDLYMKERASAHHDLANLYAAIEYLGGMPGEKYLLFMSETGIVFSRQEQAEMLARAASNARVRIFAFQTSGTVLEREEQSLDKAYQSARRAEPVYRGSAVRELALKSLATIADLSGGRRFLASELRRGLDWISNSTRSYYLLAYRPENPEVDTKSRKIEVRLTRLRAHVFHRKTYSTHPSGKAHSIP